MYIREYSLANTSPIASYRRYPSDNQPHLHPSHTHSLVPFICNSSHRKHRRHESRKTSSRRLCLRPEHLCHRNAPERNRHRPSHLRSQQHISYVGNTPLSSSPCLSPQINAAILAHHPIPAHAHSSPLSAWLRVPLTWYHSTTYAFFDDETHSSIRRVYTPPQAQATKRHFCGFCGTPLSYWSESPPSEADYISLTLGSLAGSDLRDLGELGLLPQEALGDVDVETPAEAVVPVRTPASAPVRVTQGLPWFESMIEGSKLGRVKVSRGQKEMDGGRKVEWEVVEWTDEAEEGGNINSKRKLADVDSEVVVMQAQ